MINSLEMDEEKPCPDMLVHYCRICHNEDEESNMETPCSCRGTIKYAHRNCVQRWCNEKGDTTCEICLQQFIPGYVAPELTSLFQYGGSLMNFGGNNWEISRRDLSNHHVFIAAMLAANNLEFLESEYSAPSTRTLLCCRIVATIFIVLLALRHTLSIIMILKGAEEYHSLTVGLLLMLGMIGAVVPLCKMVKVTMQQLQYQDHNSPAPLHEEHNLGRSQLRVMHIG